MRRNVVALAAVVVLPFAFGGCMMAMHGGGHAASSPHDSREMLATGQAANTTVGVIVRERGRRGEAVVAVTVTRTDSHEPVDNARVSVRFRPIGSLQPASLHGSVSSTDVIELSAVAAPDRPGVYEADHTFRSGGPHEVQVALHANEENAADLLTLTATYNAGAAGHYSRGLTPLVIIGGIVMAAGMAVRLLVF